MNLDAYIRVSDVRGRAGETFISPTVQRDKIEGYARLHGHEIARWWEELDESGGRMDRPLLQRMLRRVEAGETGGVIVAKLDRFARTLTGALATIEQIERAGGQLVVVEEQFDTTTPIGRAIMRILLVLAELQREQIGANWQEAQRRALDRGVYMSARVPVGYRRDHKGAPLELDDVTAPVVAELFERAAKGASFTTLARLLTDGPVTTSYGNTHWTTTTVRRLLRNRAYLGEARGSNGLVRRDAHPPLVTPGVFERANQLRRLPVTDRRAKSLLAGLLRCAGCRYVMTFNGSSYKCKRHHAAGSCPEPAQVREALIDALVIREFFAALGGERLVADVGGGGQVERLQAKLVAAEAELTAWRDDQAILELDRGVYRDGLAARVQRRDRARVELERLLDRAAPELPSLVELRERWPTLDTDARRHLLASAIDCVFLRRGRTGLPARVHVCWHGEGPVDLPRRAKLTPLRGFEFPAGRDTLAGEQAGDDVLERVGE